MDANCDLLNESLEDWEYSQNVEHRPLEWSPVRPHFTVINPRRPTTASPEPPVPRLKPSPAPQQSGGNRNSASDAADMQTPRNLNAAVNHTASSRRTSDAEESRIGYPNQPSTTATAYPRSRMVENALGLLDVQVRISTSDFMFKVYKKRSGLLGSHNCFRISYEYVTFGAT